MISFLDEQEETQNAFVDEIASRDCIAIEPSKSVYTSGSRDCLSAAEFSMNLYQEFPYECVHCGRRFSKTHNLFFNSKIHGKAFICKRCNRPFYESRVVSFTTLSATLK
ncbi:hypothetical protein AVEN_202612-1 [Araneus ventricosus]|uniref:C2H2-type domain-containing protein n=1 Tax=Araneus ventricosus TaxID=182803 RepID=A0A4Y2WGF6_ARAVE|nr:hypothetical protein AVEN_202612-1 [Araneus ventricosus]